MATNPMNAQGTLNRVRASVVIPGIPTLNINSSHMGKDFLSMTLDEDFTGQYETGTGVVNSPEPYVMSTVSVALLRSQALALQWLQQAEATSIIGRITIHSDTAAFAARTVHDCAILKCQPGRMDGMNPIVDLVLRGVYYLNNNLWNFA